MTEILTLVLMFGLLLLKGFFSGSEIALVSTDRIRLRHRAAQGQPGAKLAERLLQDPTRLLTTTLLGTNISSIALTTVGTLLMVSLFGGSGELVALLLFTPLFLVFGEIVPKSVYQQRSAELTPIIAYPLAWLQTALMPLVWLFSLVAILAARLVGGGKDSDDAAREQLMATVQMAEKTGTIEAFNRGQVRRVLRYAQMTAAEAMWSISDVRCLDRKTGMTELIEVRRATGQRLIPLYDNVPGNVTAVAVMESWDMLDSRLPDRSIEDYLGQVRFVPYVQRVSEILEMLHDEPGSTAIVVDEGGHAVGFITLNLLVRRTLGAELSPVTGRFAPEAKLQVQRREDGSIVLDARVPIVKVNEILNTAIKTLHHNTLGGFALARFGRLPDVGATFHEGDYEFVVTSMNERSILQLVARRIES
jgi:CBS domain containing-hemolysin-like protein